MNRHTPSVFYGVFNAEAISRLIRATVEFGSESDRFAAVSFEKRRSFSADFAHSPENTWLYERVWELFVAFNQTYALEITDIQAPIQIIRYPNGGRIDWHLDGGREQTKNERKLSLSIQLSSPDDYRGGDLEFAGQSVEPLSRTIGSAICFPSYCVHRVTPITEGERFSLVCFAVGPRFR